MGGGGGGRNHRSRCISCPIGYAMDKSRRNTVDSSVTRRIHTYRQPRRCKPEDNAIYRPENACILHTVCPASLRHSDQAFLWLSVAEVVLVCCSMCVLGCSGGRVARGGRGGDDVAIASTLSSGHGEFIAQLCLPPCCTFSTGHHNYSGTTAAAATTNHSSRHTRAPRGDLLRCAVQRTKLCETCNSEPRSATPQRI